MRLELAVYRVVFYISLMTSGEFVRFYSLSVGQDWQEHQKDLVCCIFWKIFDY